MHEGDGDGDGDGGDGVRKRRGGRAGGKNAQRAGGGGGGRTAIMRVSLLTECVEILDGHTTNKRDPSDDIELRSASDGCGAGRRTVGEMLLDRHLNGAWTPVENGVDKTKRDGRVRSRK